MTNTQCFMFRLSPTYLIPEESLSRRKFFHEAFSLNFIAPALHFDLEKIATRLASAGGAFGSLPIQLTINDEALESRHSS